MLSALKKLALHSIALKKMAKHGVNWHFSALPQSHARFFTRDEVLGVMEQEAVGALA